MTGALPSTYAEAVSALQARGRFGIRLGLARTRALLRALGDPQRTVTGALIGGTNGKGSVVALMAACLAAAGYRVGATPKPHLVTYRERLVLDGHPIAPDAFVELVRDAIPIADDVARRHGPPTEFELVTAMAFTWLARERPDLAIVEVGLGGRLDATHAWDGGVAAITNVDLDHTEWLGQTVVAIAREKAAIINRGDLAVTGAGGDALRVIARRARRVAAPLRTVTAAPVLAMDLAGIVIEIPGLGPTRVGLLGRHQAANVAVADAALDALAEARIATVPPDARRAGYAAARWPGRLELIDVRGAGPHGADVRVLLDGAHNPAGARALAAAVEEIRPLLPGAGDPAPAADRRSAGHRAHPSPVSLVVGAMADKDVDGVIGALLAVPAFRGARVYATAVDTPRALPALDLASRWAAADATAAVTAVVDPREALEAAIAAADGPVVVAGSLYLVGAARALLASDPELVDPS